MLILCTVAAALAAVADIDAAVIFSNPITDSNPSSANPFTAGQTVAANVTAVGIGRGSGINANAGSNRYNARDWNTSFDLTDYFTFTLDANAGYELDLTNFVYTGTASGSGPTSFAFRSSLDNFATNIGAASAGGATISLTASAYQNLTSPIEFRFYGWGGNSAAGTFSINEFTFNGDVIAVPTGNNSSVTAPSSDSFGRVMLGQTPTRNLSLTKTGSDATTYSATASSPGILVTADGSLLGSVASGSIAGGSQSEVVGVQLAANANGSLTTGAKSYTVTIDNTAGTSAASGQGSGDANDVVNVSATVVDNRTVSSSLVNFGSVIAGAPTGNFVSSLSTTDGDNDRTRITVLNAGATSGGVNVATAPSNTVFNNASVSQNRNVSAIFATAGAYSGSVSLSATGEGLLGEAVNEVAVPYSAMVFDSSSAAFDSNDATTLTIDFGEVLKDSGVLSLADAIYNAMVTAGFTATLDFDTILGVGATDVLFTDLENGEFSNHIAGKANAYSFLAFFDTSHPNGNYSASYTVGFSDGNGYIGASAANSQTLTLNVTGTIVPEPTAFILLTVGLSIVAICRRSCH